MFHADLTDLEKKVNNFKHIYIPNPKDAKRVDINTSQKDMSIVSSLVREGIRDGGGQ